MTDRPTLTAEETARVLLDAEAWTILCHQYPDGDTIGSAFALCRALQEKGKRARVLCADVFPEKYAYLTQEVAQDAPADAAVCAVDVADPRLLGDALAEYAARVTLCIDHHMSNTGYAQYTFLRDDAAAAMLVREVIAAMGVTPDRLIAEALYTGIATDTGCFKYSNTDARTHRVAADMMDYGVRTDAINRAMFDVKSRARIELERLALAAMTFDFDGRVAMMPITEEMIRRAGVQENDMEGLAPIPRQIEGVWVGVTLREKPDGSFKVSVRTGTHVNASEVCGLLGGGGHAAAAGCTLNGPLEEAKQRILSAIAQIKPCIAQER